MCLRRGGTARISEGWNCSFWTARRVAAAVSRPTRVHVILADGFRAVVLRSGTARISEGWSRSLRPARGIATTVRLPARVDVVHAYGVSAVFLMWCWSRERFRHCQGEGGQRGQCSE